MHKNCKNHHSVTAKRRCYNCRQYICPQCQIKRLHHIFCSWLCIFKFITADIYTAHQKAFKYGSIAAGLVTACVIFYLLFADSREAEPEYVVPQTQAALTAPRDTNYSVTTQGLYLRGRTIPNTIIAVKKGPEYIATQIARSDTFIFEDLPLTYGNNHLTVWAIREDGRVVLIDSIDVNYRGGQLSLLATPVYRVKTAQKIISLTFDAGSAANGADSIIQILHDFKIWSTIFLTGQFIKRFPELVLQLEADGHELANHSLNHPHLTTWAQNRNHNTLPGVSRTFLQQQLQRTDSLYLNLTGNRLSKFWRAPYGEFNSDILLWAAEIGYRHIGWSPGCDSFDWVSDTTSSMYRTPQELYDHLMTLEQHNRLNGAILLMHLNSNRESNHAYEMLPKLITQLTDKGYKFVPISALLSVNKLP